jgi:hypothetical protein
MTTYEVTYKVAGVKYDCSYIVSADDIDQARHKADAWVKREAQSAHKFISIKPIKDES